MPEFTSWQSYWHFERMVRENTRYVRDSEGERFLAAVHATAMKRVDSIPAGSFVWRAQLGHVLEERVQGGERFDVSVPLPADRMKPLRDRAKEGRANPKGIPCLYAATNRETALAEVRPWIGSLISVGQFKVQRTLRVVNCTIHRKGYRVYSGEEPCSGEREESVWCDIDAAFARPVSVSDDLADYATTQVIAELFKVHGFDGVAYASSLGSGHNLAIFDMDDADLINCFLFEVVDLTFKFNETGNPYFVKACGTAAHRRRPRLVQGSRQDGKGAHHGFLEKNVRWCRWYS